MESEEAPPERIRLYVPEDFKADEERLFAVLDEIHGGGPIAEIVTTSAEGTARYALGWAISRNVAFRVCAPAPLDTEDLYQLKPLDEEEDDRPDPGPAPRPADMTWLRTAAAENRPLTARQAVAARCWLDRHQEEAGALKPYVERALERFGGYDRALAMRDECDLCREGWRIENLRLCAECQETLCPNCQRRACLACGAEMVG